MGISSTSGWPEAHVTTLAQSLNSTPYPSCNTRRRCRRCVSLAILLDQCSVSYASTPRGWQLIGNGSEGLSVDEGGVGDSGADLLVHVEGSDGGRLLCRLGRGLVEIFRLAESERGQSAKVDSRAPLDLLKVVAVIQVLFQSNILVRSRRVRRHGNHGVLVRGDKQGRGRQQECRGNLHVEYSLLAVVSSRVEPVRPVLYMQSVCSVR